MTDIDHYNENGRTKLMEAAISGDTEELERLLELGADPFIKDRDFGSTTAKMYAGRKAKKSEIHALIEKRLSSLTGEEICAETPPEPEIEPERDRPLPSNGELGIVAFAALACFVLGFISLILAPFTGITVITSAAFFVIGYILSKL